MLILKQLGKFPPAFESRNDSIDSVEIKKIRSIEGKNNNLLFVSTSGTKKYTTKIFIVDKNKKLLSPVQISCNCSSFIFEFEYACNTVGSLYGKRQGLDKKPEVKNPKMIPTGCKHIHALARIIRKELYKKPKNSRE